MKWPSISKRFSLITSLSLEEIAEFTMDIGPPELIIILIIVVLLFGVGRISKIAGELGGGIRAFREGLQEPEDEKKTSTDKVVKSAEPENTNESKKEAVKLDDA
jgi:sec-independent protein translocase protein TatA